MEKTNRQIFRLSDNVLAHFVRLFQIGFLTGTDVTDHWRQVVLEPGDKPGELVLTPEYKAKDEKDIDAMFSHLETLMAQDKS